MTDDATALLIKRMLSEADPAAAQNISAASGVLSGANDLLSNAASYAQIFSTAEGPAAAAAAIAVQGAISPAAATAFGESVELSGVVAAGAASIGAAIVLIFAFALASLSGNSASAEAEAIEQLGQALNNLGQDFTNVGLGSYWQEKLTALMSAWNSPDGGLGDDLDNLSAQGTKGSNVTGHVGDFHNNAMGFVNSFIPDKTPGSEIFWERPVLANQGFAAQLVPYYGSSLSQPVIMGWYGNIPTPQPAPSFQGNQMVSDPRTMLPFLVLGLKSYLTIEMLLQLIDSNQQTFDQFLAQYSGDLQDYTSFVYSQYLLAVNGIVKSDTPKVPDLVGFLAQVAGYPEGWGYALETDPAIPSRGSVVQQSASIPPQPSDKPATAGYWWNGVYGAVNTYPQYGYYQPGPPAPVPGASPAYVIDSLYLDASTNMMNELQQAGALNDVTVLADGTTFFQRAVNYWVLPWLQNKFTLGSMARWKAIYLLNGYDKLWSILQQLELLSKPNPPIAPATLLLKQDGMIADGNWSMRELFAVLNFNGFMLNGIPSNEYPFTTNNQPSPNGYSLSGLIQVLDNIANGNWAGPPPYPLPGPGAPRPLSLRGKLAAAAD